MGKNKPGFHAEIWARWGDIVGKELARRILPSNFHNGVLIASVANSSWMQELTYLKPTLLDRFAEEIGPNVVRDIRLVLDVHMSIEKNKPEPKKLPFDNSPVDVPSEIELATQAIEDDSLRQSAEKAVIASFRRNRR